MASRPMPRVRQAASTSCGGNTWLAPQPSRISSGSSANKGSSAETCRVRASVTGQSSTSLSGATMKLASRRRWLTRAERPSAPRRKNSKSGCSWNSCMATTASGARQDDLAPVLGRAVQHGHVADPLHQRGVHAAGDLVDQQVASLAVGRGHLHLDQLVVFQGPVDLGHQRVRHTLAAHLQHRLEVVRCPAQEAVLGGGQGNRHREVGGGRGGAGYHAARTPFPGPACSATAPMAPPALPLAAGRGKNVMATRSKSSQRWLKEHFSDPFVKKAQAEGLRSRAAYKLEELVERDRLLKPGMLVVDLGAAPGGWSQWLRQELDRLDPARPGRVIAVDILEMPPLAGVEFLHGDFREDAVLSGLETLLGGQPVDLVLSDMAPNKSGMDAV